LDLRIVAGTYCDSSAVVLLESRGVIDARGRVDAPARRQGAGASSMRRPATRPSSSPLHPYCPRRSAR